MRLLALLAAGMFVGGLIAADDKKDEKQGKDEDGIVGKWKVEKLDVGSPDAKAPTAEELAKMSITFAKDGKVVTVTPDGSEKDGSYKLDPAAKPKTIDLTRSGSKDANPGVYELDGDTLKICLNQAGTTRPTEFKADGKGVFVMTMKRVKDEPKKDK